MAIEIVDFPSYKMVIFHSYVSLPEGRSKHCHLVEYGSKLNQGKTSLERWLFFLVLMGHTPSIFRIEDVFKPSS